MEAVSAYARASRLAPRWVAEAVDPAPIAQVARTGPDSKLTLK